jgi:hypothetical protein
MRKMQQNRANDPSRHFSPGICCAAQRLIVLCWAELLKGSLSTLSVDFIQSSVACQAVVSLQSINSRNSLA